MRTYFKYLLPVFCIVFAMYGYVAMMHGSETDGNALSLVSSDAQVHQQNEHHNKWHATHAQKTIKQHNKHHRKISHAKHISFEAIPLTIAELPLYSFFEKKLLPTTNVAYLLIFCREINPPPPKHC